MCNLPRQRHRGSHWRRWPVGTTLSASPSARPTGKQQRTARCRFVPRIGDISGCHTHSWLSSQPLCLGEPGDRHPTELHSNLQCSEYWGPASHIIPGLFWEVTIPAAQRPGNLGMGYGHRGPGSCLSVGLVPSQPMLVPLLPPCCDHAYSLRGAGSRTSLSLTSFPSSPSPSPSLSPAIQFVIIRSFLPCTC